MIEFELQKELDEAEQRLQEAKARLARHAHHIACLAEAGRSTIIAEALHSVMTIAVDSMRAQRDLIRLEIDRGSAAGMELDRPA